MRQPLFDAIVIFLEKPFISMVCMIFGPLRYEFRPPLFEEADNFGSLIRPDVTDVDGMLRILKSKNVSGQLFISMTHQKVLQALRQADYLSPKYHVVIANPPYMGSKGMNGRLAAWAKVNYPSSKTDLFAMFVEHNLGLVMPAGSVAMITMQNWMFLYSYSKFRRTILDSAALMSMAHLGTRAFESIGGEVVSTTAFILKAKADLNFEGDYFRLVGFESSDEKNAALLLAVKDPGCDWRYKGSTAEFMKIPGEPIVYWVGNKILNCFSGNAKFVKDFSPAKQGMATCDNARFIRLWHEVSFFRINTKARNLIDTDNSIYKWYPHNKGGDRRWFGNNDYLVNWQENGQELREYVEELNKLRPGGRLKNQEFYLKQAASWADINSGSISARFIPDGYFFDTTGPSIFNDDHHSAFFYVAMINSAVVEGFASLLNPTLHFTPNDANNLPLPKHYDTKKIEVLSNSLILNSKADWDSYETSWGFNSLPLLNADYRQPTLKATYQTLRAHWREITLEMQQLEEENNRVFIDAYGLQDELTPEVPLNEITLTCNPHYRYGNDKSEDELEALLLADTMRELVSYSVGCMFGRYALDKPGLILANQGETIEDYLKRVPHPSFPADDDNVIPILDGDWFTDDIAERFRKFLRVAFGDEHYEENLQFVEQALNIKGKRNYSIRDYFLGEFYTDHVKRYKKRPIYWLFSSPKGSFNALIYMHRYRPDTVSVVLNDYLREFRTKLTSHKNHLEAVSISASSSQGEKTQALKEIEKITKMIAETEGYEREVLYPLATEQVEIDLDDGVKVNYPKFGAALKKIPGLGAKED